MQKTRAICLAAALAVVAACKKHESSARSAEPAAKGKGDPAATAVEPEAPVEASRPPPPPRTEGERALSPVVTASGITFAVPRGSDWWGAMAMPCYKAAVGMSPGVSPTQMIAMQAPWLLGALRDAEIDLMRDVVSVGALDCGEEPCMYAAAELKQPAKARAILDGYSRDGGGGKVESLTPTHHTMSIQGVSGPRTVHLEVVAVDWSAAGAPPRDVWAKEARRATHVIFFYGVESGVKAPDPLAALAFGEAALARVKEVESLTADTGGRCLIGAAGPMDDELKPGHKLTGARFLVVAPMRGEADVAARALGSPRSVVVEVELSLAPAPTDGDVRRWIEEARAFVADIVGPMLPQLEASMGAYGGELVRALAALAEAGFAWKLDGGALRLSWGTPNVSAGELARIGL